MDRAPIVLLAGPPGSGKSTVASLVADRFDRSVCLESDWFWTTIVRGLVAPWLPEADAQNRTVLRACAAAAVRMAAGGYTLLMNGILGPWYLDLVLDELRSPSGAVHYTVLRPAIDVALERATSRLPLVPGTAPLTEEGPIRQLWESFQDLGSYESHVVDNGALGPEETASVVWARFAEGTDRL